MSRPLVFIVDDVPENIQIALAHLKSLDLDFAYATSGEQAVERMRRRMPDLVLLDVMMPGMDGFETLREFRKIDGALSIPVIFLTARSEPEDVAKGFELGGVDYITKPFHGVELRSRVRNHLDLHRYKMYLEQTVEVRTREASLLKDITIVAMGELAEHRDTDTGGHIQRTRSFVRALAEELRRSGKFVDLLSPEYITLLYKTAPLHDIGKVGIPDGILLKKGRLNWDEFEIMKLHVRYGEEVIDKLSKMAGEPMAFLLCAKDLVGGHHEKFDGSGYPRGLAGRDIPLAGRIMALADVYDALRTRRAYKPAFTHEQTMEIITHEEGRNRHFDPDVFDALLRVEKEFAAIAQKNRDEMMC
ncbi:response regulator [Candidatus Electronema sp. JM]|uniref:response regulator n=1 Tax=Candidatus Electronema sp. JM TaxID=3401571 RepID=UPI003AA7DAAD